MNNDTQPLVEPAPDAFPLHYRSPYVPGKAAQPALPEQGPTLEEWDQRIKHDLERRIRELQASGQADSDYPDEKQAYLQKWGPIAEQQYQQEEPPIHIHGPFVFLMNQNHNALRGCVTCGATWVGLMAGAEENLVWHPVGELPEEEE